MKKTIFYLFTSASLVLAMASCKNNHHEAEAGEAKEAATAATETMEYKVDTAASSIQWKGEKPTGYHHGSIKVGKGTFKANDSVVESGNFTIDMVSINVEDLEGDDKEKLENHLKGTVEGKEGDFFNVQKFPEAVFEVTGMRTEDGQKMMEGNLRIKEDTKNISFPVMLNRTSDGIEIKSKKFTIDRTNWKVNYGSKSVFDGLGDNFISDDIELQLDIKADKA